MKFRTLLIVGILLGFSWNLFSQDQDKPKLTTMYIVDGKEMKEEDVMKIDPNRIKTMQKGISDNEKKKLEEKFGEKVNESYIIMMTLRTDEEMGNQAVLSVEEQEKKKQDAMEQARLSTLIHAGDEARDFNVTMLDGTSIQLSELKGKVVLLNFWATWCGPCMREFYEIPSTLLSRFENQDFVFLPISRGETEAVVRKKMEQLKAKGIDFNVGLDPTKEIYNQYATQTIPRNFLIDRNGLVVESSIGYNEAKLKALADKIEALLQAN